jgi:hypothetical protein
MPRIIFLYVDTTILMCWFTIFKHLVNVGAKTDCFHIITIVRIIPNAKYCMVIGDKFLNQLERKCFHQILSSSPERSMLHRLI